MARTLHASQLVALTLVAVVVPWASCAGSCAGGARLAAPGGEAEAQALAELEPAEEAENALAASETEPEPEPEPEPEFVCELGTPDGAGGCTVTPEDRRNALTVSERWEHVLSSCPSEEYGSFASLWRWEPSAEELRMSEFDLLGSGTTFDFLADFEGTSIIVRVRDAATRERLGVIKTTSSNTRVEAEIYAYRLATFLGFEELVPDVLPVELVDGALQKLRELLDGQRMRDENKERNRRRVLASVDAAIADGGGFHGAMKPWLTGFIFHSGLGRRESLGAAEVMGTLRHRRPQPTDAPVRLRQYTRLYEPLGTHQGTIPMWQLAVDLSNLMLLDALTGQNDRFPGANLHFVSTSGEVEVVGERRGRPIFEMGPVRLLALDNGAALRSSAGSGIADLQGNVVSGTRVERFDRESIERLYALARRTRGHGCEMPPFDDEVAAIWAYLGLPESADQAIADRYLENVLTYLERLHAAQGGALFIEPNVSTDPADEGDQPSSVDSDEVVSIDGEEETERAGETSPSDADPARADDARPVPAVEQHGG